MIITRAAVASRPNFRSFNLGLRLALALAGCVAGGAVAVNAQTPAGRPVARLVTASRQVPVPMRARRMTAVTPASMTGATPVPSSAMSIERRAFNLINAQRIANGEAPFTWDEELCRMARKHSENMARQDFFNHVGRDGMDTVDRARALNIRGWKALGENIAYNQGFDDPAASAVERWMLSAKHRNNILNSMFTRSGLGIARAADGRIFFTQVFIAR